MFRNDRFNLVGALIGDGWNTVLSTTLISVSIVATFLGIKWSFAMFSTSKLIYWKKALDNRGYLTKHASSRFHFMAAKNHLSFKQREESSSKIVRHLESVRTIQIWKNRNRLVKISSTLLVLSRWMIAFRRHEETDRSVYLTCPQFFHYCGRNLCVKLCVSAFHLDQMSRSGCWSI